MPARDTAVSVRGLSKSYTITHSAPSHTTLAEAFLHRFRQPLAKFDQETFWALRDINFDIHKGDVVGIIGRNGAGKSTLLKILSRITEPTTGQIDLYGRVGSLLEVGTGFHPELTGRENIYMNGAILGMSRREITRQFDDIVEFAEVEKFLDTPVKRYSSGMYVRLAFAIAAHLNPEILIVDEVLAVGDAEFQKKCLGKMKDVSQQEGRTVLFVSHNMAAVKNLCDRCVLLRKGSAEEVGSVTDAVNAYLTDGVDSPAQRRWSVKDAPGDDAARLLSVRTCQPAETPTASIDMNEAFEIEIEMETSNPMPPARLNLSIISDEGQTILRTVKIVQGDSGPKRPGRSVSVCRVPAHTLNAGNYFLSLDADIPNVRAIFREESVLRWNVQPFVPDSALFDSPVWPGVISPGIVHWSESHQVASVL